MYKLKVSVKYDVMVAAYPGVSEIGTSSLSGSESWLTKLRLEACKSQDVSIGMGQMGFWGKVCSVQIPLFFILALDILFNSVWLCPSLGTADAGDTVYWLITRTQILLLGTACPLRQEQMWITQGRSGNDRQEAFGLVH